MALPTMSDFNDLMARFGNDQIHSQAEVKSVVWNELPRKSMAGGKQVVNVVTPGHLGGGAINGDGGTRQGGSSRTPVQGYVLPKFLHRTLKFNNSILATYKDVGDAADYLDAEINSVGDGFAQDRESIIFGSAGKICTIVSCAAPVNAAIDTVEITVADFAGFLEGNAYEVAYRSVGTADGYVHVLGLESITPAATGFGAVLKFADNVPGVTHSVSLPTLGAYVAGSEIYVRGALNQAQIGLAAGATITVSGDVGVSLQDIASQSSTLHELSPSTAGLSFWKGNSFDINGAAGTQEMVLGRTGQIRRHAGETPDLLFCGQGLHNALAASALTVASSAFGLSSVGNTRRMVDATMNKYGKEIADENRMMIGKTRVILDDNVPSDASAATDNSAGDGYANAFLVNTSKLSIGEWIEITPEKQGNDQFIVDHTDFATKAFFHCAFNLICTSRRSHAKIQDIAVAL